MTSRSETVVIVGGAIMGSFVAFFLKHQGFKGSIKVIERDFSYQKSSTALSASAIRTQFGCAINAKLTLFAAELFRNITTWFGIDADINFQEKGYLILHRSSDIFDTVELLNSVGADISVLDPAQLISQFPWLNVDGIECGTYGNQHEGWFDAWSLLQCVRATAKQLGVEYIKAEASQLKIKSGQTVGVELSTGDTLPANWVVNAAGALSPKVTQSLGIQLPVVPRKRTVFSISTPLSNNNFPMMIDLSGVWIRPEGSGFICGIAPDASNDPDAYGDFDPDYELFEENVWTNLATRVPALESLRLESAWAGHYEINTFDYNGIVGFHTEVSNLLFATGFSGHGVMQAPAVGRGVAELIRTGGYESLDLTPLDYSRIEQNKPIVEAAVF